MPANQTQAYRVPFNTKFGFLLDACTSGVACSRSASKISAFSSKLIHLFWLVGIQMTYAAAAVSLDNFASISTTAPVSCFLAAALHEAGPGREQLYREISRINPPKNLDVS